MSGTVEDARADGFAPGLPVFGVTFGGAYAEYATAPATAVAPKPEGLSFLHAAALPMSGSTAWQALYDRGLTLADVREAHAIGESGQLTV